MKVGDDVTVYFTFGEDNILFGKLLSFPTDMTGQCFVVIDSDNKEHFISTFEEIITQPNKED